MASLCYLRVLLMAALASMLTLTCLANSNWDQAARDQVLKIHNDFRKGEHGQCHMNKLVYDMELENQAKKWAEHCVFEHETIKGRGENLAWNSMEMPESELIEGSTQRWFDEKKMYSYGQYSCGMSCHYTQMVWGATSKVGCYSYRCPNLVNAYQNAWYLVCFYTPVGNWNGEKPYDRQCKSQCLEGQTEEDGLCVGEATNAKNQGEDDDTVCDDDQGRCPQWAKQGECQNNEQYMKSHCRKSCKLCTVEGGETCEDKGGAQCSTWADQGQCRTNPSYMLKNCAKSCHNC